MTAPKVSVLVVSYNRSADLRLALQAILDTNYPSLEIIVVDNASTDDALAVARSFPQAKVVESKENLGFARGNDLALEHATGDYLALVNNDAVVDSRFFEALVDFLESHPDAAAAGGKQYLWNEHNELRNRANPSWGYSVLTKDAHTPAVLDAPDEIREVTTLSGAAVMVRRRAIDDVGLPFLDPEFFMYYEETDFFARALRRGWKLFYVPESACWHRVRAGTASAPYRYYFQMNRNRLLFANRNFDDGELAKIVAVARRLAQRAALPGGRVLLGISREEQRAIVDAWKWGETNAALLEEHRRKELGAARPYHDAVREVESRLHNLPPPPLARPRAHQRAIAPRTTRRATGAMLRAVPTQLARARTRLISLFDDAAVSEVLARVLSPASSIISLGEVADGLSAELARLAPRGAIKRVAAGDRLDDVLDRDAPVRLVVLGVNEELAATLEGARETLSRWHPYVLLLGGGEPRLIERAAASAGLARSSLSRWLSPGARDDGSNVEATVLLHPPPT